MNTDQGYLLLVEDDPDILVLLDTTLKFRDYRVVTAPNGRDALEIVQKERPKIVIADIMMPHLDGYGLVHRLRINPETRLIGPPRDHECRSAPSNGLVEELINLLTSRIVFNKFIISPAARKPP